MYSLAAVPTYLPTYLPTSALLLRYAAGAGLLLAAAVPLLWRLPPQCHSFTKRKEEDEVKSGYEEIHWSVETLACIE